MSEIKANTISDAAGTGPINLYKQSAAKAWVNFNGTGTVAIRDSVNISSITDDGTGRYLTNFSTSFSAANYTFNANKGRSSGDSGSVNLYSNSLTPTTSVAKFLVVDQAYNAQDEDYVSVTIHGDLA